MPAIYAHQKFGHDVLNNLKDYHKNIIINNIQLFDIGLQGPDIFFYYKPIIPHCTTIKGYSMHKQIAADHLYFFKNNISECDKDKMLAYIYGYVLHFCLDNCFHKYIQFYKKKTDISHATIETEFDKMLMKHDKIDLNNVSLKRIIILSNENISIISKLYNMSEQKINTSLSSMIKYTDMLTSATKLQKITFKTLLLITGQYKSKSCFLFSKEPRKDCKNINYILSRQYKKAMSLAPTLIDNCSNFLKYDIPLDDNFYHTFSWKDKKYNNIKN